MRELNQMLNTFNETAFRLETLPEYFEASEQRLLQAYRDGVPVPRVTSGWPEFVKSKVYGRRIQRVRLVERQPSTYIAFELDWLYPPNHEAGEDIRIRTVDTPYRGPDFWLFDGKSVLRLQYKAGALTGTERSDNRSDVRVAQETYDHYCRGAVPLPEYLVQRRGRQ